MSTKYNLSLDNLIEILEAYCIARDEGFLLRMIRGKLSIQDYLKAILEHDDKYIIEQEADVKSCEAKLANTNDESRIEYRKNDLIRSQKRLKELKDNRDRVDELLKSKQPSPNEVKQE